MPATARRGRNSYRRERNPVPAGGYRCDAAVMTPINHEDAYDPFDRGRVPVGVATIHANDQARDRIFPYEVWYPAAEHHAGQDLAADTQDAFTLAPGNAPRRQAAVRDAAPRPGRYPLVVFSHQSGGYRCSATFLCTHLASHGYMVAALDHSEVVTPELRRDGGLAIEQRVAGSIAGRVPDVRFLLDQLLGGAGWSSPATPDPHAVGIIGHSFGGWTALATPDVEPRIRAVVALAPGGSSRPLPGMIPATLEFGWGRDVPTLYLVAERDTFTPLAGMYELLDRTPATRQLVVLRRADHLHFIDDVEHEHEAVRAMSFSGEAAWIPAAMPPIAELCPGAQAHLFNRGLALCHLDATLRGHEPARRLLAGDVEATLADRGVDVMSTPRIASP